MPSIPNSKMQPRILFFISGIIGVVFLILVIALNVTEVINFGSMMAGILVIMLIVILANVVNWWVKSRKIEGVPSSKSMKVEEARAFAQEIITGTTYSEIERELLHEDVWSMGRKNTPIYVRLVKGDFDGNIISVLINMENPQKFGHKPYSPELRQEEIERDILKRANLLSATPKPEERHKVISSLDPHTGQIVSQETPIEEQEEEGGLQ